MQYTTMLAFIQLKHFHYSCNLCIIGVLFTLPIDKPKTPCRVREQQMYNENTLRKSFLLIAVLVFTAFLLASCRTATFRIVEPDHASENFSGRYSGVLPCADCPGILTILEISDSGVFFLREIYLDRENSEFFGRGTWEAREENQLMLFFDQDSRQIRLRNTAIGLHIINNDGSEISTGFPGLYLLEKSSTSLQNSRWRLQKLNVEGVWKSYQTEVEAGFFISFSSEGFRYAAKAGCNTLIGEYAVSSEGDLNFTPPASTLMACPDMAAEEQLKKVLINTRNWKIRGDQMWFVNQHGEELAELSLIPPGEGQEE